MIFEKCDGEWRIRIGRFELYRNFFPLEFHHRWWYPRWGKMQNSAASRNYDWFGWTFRIYRRWQVWSLLNRRFSRDYHSRVASPNGASNRGAREMG